MKRQIVLFFVITFIISLSTFGQKRYMPNGGMFTPEGEIKALVVFVGFSHKVWNGKDSIPFNHQPYDKWDIKNGQELPPYANLETGKLEIFHDDVSDFGKKADVYNISDYYYQMSLGKLKFMAEIYRDKNNQPKRIDINPAGLSSISAFNKAVMDKIYQENPTFDWTRFDTRINAPNYVRNTNKTRSDGKPECVIFVYRNHGGMSNQVYLKNRLGWGGGIATSYLKGFKSNWENIKFDNTGFTLSDESGKSGDSFFAMFLHEIGHKLYNAPHYNGANGAVGTYFYYPEFSYGMMNSTNFSNITANGWERWILGWINLDKNNIDAHSSIPRIDGKTYSFVINDFVTTGDALRLPIPNYPDNYLWIENHQNISEMERSLFQGQTLSQNKEIVPDLETGIYAYIERISPSRNFIPSYGNKYQSNGLRMMHAEGNWDYVLSKKITKNWYNYFNQPIISVSKTRKNIFSGTNPFRRFIGDFPQGWKEGNEPDQKINYKTFIHGGYIESIPFIQQNKEEDTLFVYGFSGGVTDKMKTVLNAQSPFFQDKSELSNSSGNPVYGLQVYDKRKGKLDPIILNGMKVSFEKLEGNSFLVTVKFDEFSIEKSQRWSGELKIMPNYIDSSDYSLIINKNVEITLDKSGTINSHKKTTSGDFISNSNLSFDPGSRIHLQSGAKLIIKDNSTVEIKGDSYLKMDNKSKIIVEKGSQLIIRDGATIDKVKSARIIIY